MKALKILMIVLGFAAATKPMVYADDELDITLILLDKEGVPTCRITEGKRINKGLFGFNSNLYEDVLPEHRTDNVDAGLVEELEICNELELSMAMPISLGMAVGTPGLAGAGGAKTTIKTIDKFFDLVAKTITTTFPVGCLIGISHRIMEANSGHRTDDTTYMNQQLPTYYLIGGYIGNMVRRSTMFTNLTMPILLKFGVPIIIGAGSTTAAGAACSGHLF